MLIGGYRVGQCRVNFLVGGEKMFGGRAERLMLFLGIGRLVCPMVFGVACDRWTNRRAGQKSTASFPQRVPRLYG